MRTRAFFRWVWRVNAIVILMAALMMVAGFLAALFQIYRDFTHRSQGAPVVKVVGEEIDRTKVTLGSFQLVQGTGVFRATLQTDLEHGFGSGSGGGKVARNFLFYDPSDRSSRWLLPGNKGLFLATHELPEEGCSSRSGPMLAVVYELVEADTNGDGKLTGEDAKVIAVSSPSGSRFTRVLTAVQEVNGTGLGPDGRVVVLYTSAGALRAAEVDGATHRVVGDGALQAIKEQTTK